MYLCPTLAKIGMCPQISVKISNTQFGEIRTDRSHGIPCGQTSDMKILRLVSHNFTTAVPTHLKKLIAIIKKLKGKVIPLQAWTGPDGSRRLRLPDFKTVGT